MRYPEKSNDEVYNRIILLMQENGITQAELADHLGVQRATLASWRNNKKRSYLKYIDSIAEYFGVTYDFILHGSQALDHNHLTPDEKTIISKYRSLSMEERSLLLKIINAI